MCCHACLFHFQLSIHNGLTSSVTEDSFDVCKVIMDVDLQPGGHFSVSAATGGLAGGLCA